LSSKLPTIFNTADPTSGQILPYTGTTGHLHIAA